MLFRSLGTSIGGDVDVLGLHETHLGSLLFDLGVEAISVGHGGDELLSGLVAGCGGADQDSIESCFTSGSKIGGNSLSVNGVSLGALAFCESLFCIGLTFLELFIVSPELYKLGVVLSALSLVVGETLHDLSLLDLTLNSFQFPDEVLDGITSGLDGDLDRADQVDAGCASRGGLGQIVGQGAQVVAVPPRRLAQIGRAHV